MSSLYYFEPLPGVSLVPWLERVDGTFVEKVRDEVKNPFAHYTEAALADADAAIVPNNFKQLDSDSRAYIQTCVDRAQAAGKPVFLFSCGDLTDKLRFDSRAYVFRLSTYRRVMTRQDIVIPTLTNDLGAKGVSARPYTTKAVVSFCGQAGYKTGKQWLRYYLKVVVYQALGIFSATVRARTIGVYWRRRMLASCRRSKRVDTKFVLRNSFSGAARTIELDPAQARREFIDSIVESDFVLAPKGDGNYSNRFLEALSLGRVPVLLDTEVLLPLQDEIDYSTFVVGVPMSKVGQTAKIIAEWYDAHTDDSWCALQIRAREIYETRLRFDSFFDYFFTSVLPRLPIDARENRR